MSHDKTEYKIGSDLEFAEAVKEIAKGLFGSESRKLSELVMRINKKAKDATLRKELIKLISSQVTKNTDSAFNIISPDSVVISVIEEYIEILNESYEKIKSINANDELLVQIDKYINLFAIAKSNTEELLSSNAVEILTQIVSGSDDAEVKLQVGELLKYEEQQQFHPVSFVKTDTGRDALEEIEVSPEEKFKLFLSALVYKVRKMYTSEGGLLIGINKSQVELIHNFHDKLAKISEPAEFHAEAEKFVNNKGNEFILSPKVGGFLAGSVLNLHNIVGDAFAEYSQAYTASIKSKKSAKKVDEITFSRDSFVSIEI